MKKKYKKSKENNIFHLKSLYLKNFNISKEKK